jgi:hypothetical protein
MIDERERRLHEREARVEAREQRLDDRERRLDERERRVAARERRDEPMGEVISVSDDDDQPQSESTADNTRMSTASPDGNVKPEWTAGVKRVSVVTPDGAFYLRLVASIRTVDDLKILLEGIVGIPKAWQRIDVGRICLDDPSAYLNQCDVFEGATLHLRDLVPHSSMFPVSIKSLNGSTCQVNVAGDMRIARVQFLLWFTIGAPPDQQRLIFKGKQLEELRTVAECGLSPDSTVHLVLRLRGDIGVWGAAENGPGAAVLRGVAPPTPAACAEVRVALLTGPLAAANPPAPVAVEEPLLDALACDALCRAADAAIETAENASAAARRDAVFLHGGAVKVLLRQTPGIEGAATDWQVELASDTVVTYVGAVALAGLKLALGAAALRFVVRRVDAGAGVEAIPFHTDYARRTLQVPLNEPLAAADDDG